MRLPKWIPHELKDWFDALRRDPSATEIRLVTSLEMREFWELYSAGRPHAMLRFFSGSFDTIGNPIVIEEEKPSPSQVLNALRHSTSFPDKPSDMTPKAREVYLDKVKKHALALIDLLEDTKYDRSILDEFGFIHERAKPLDRETLEERLIKEIRGMIDFCTKEDCILQADYIVDEKGDVYKRGSAYPYTDLVHSLRELVSWASKDDYYNFMHSVIHIRQSGIHARKTHYLAQLNEHFKRLGLSVPFAHYATAANVALDLPENECLDEESARKQLLRIRQRIEQAQLR